MKENAWQHLPIQKKNPQIAAHQLTEASQYPLASKQYIPKNIGAL
jgi:hypothetical protein